MTRQLSLLVILFPIFLIDCGQKRAEIRNNTIETNSIQFDNSIIAVFPYDSSENWLFKDCKPAELTNEDFLVIEKLLKKCIDEYNPSKEKEFIELNSVNPNLNLEKKNFIIDLTRYKRQYIAMVNNIGEKVVWINCFCNTLGNNWKEKLIFVKDGRNCYFNLKINLTREQFYELTVNGDA
ncbi:MAG: hypothetical protein AB9846_13980 [Tenuifilaceae bacterium]